MGESYFHKYFSYVPAVSKQAGRRSRPIFRPVATDMGFCLAANAEPMKNILNEETSFKDVFEEAFAEEIIQDSTVQNNNGWGKQYGLEFTTDIHLTNIGELIDDPDAKTRGQYITLKWKHDAFGVRQEMEHLRPGHTTVIRFGTLITNVTEDVRGMDAGARGCRLAGENGGMEVLRRYTQRGCQFECQLKRNGESFTIPGRIKYGPTVFKRWANRTIYCFLTSPYSKRTNSVTVPLECAAAYPGTTQIPLEMCP